MVCSALDWAAPFSFFLRSQCSSHTQTHSHCDVWLIQLVDANTRYTCRVHIYGREQWWMFTCATNIYWFCSGTEIKNLGNILHRFGPEHFSFFSFRFVIINRYTFAKCPCGTMNFYIELPALWHKILSKYEDDWSWLYEIFRRFLWMFKCISR